MTQQALQILQARRDAFSDAAALVRACSRRGVDAAAGLEVRVATVDAEIELIRSKLKERKPLIRRRPERVGRTSNLGTQVEEMITGGL